VTRFLTVFVRRCDPDVVVAAIEQNYHLIPEAQLIAKLKVFLDARPEIRGELIAAAHLEGQLEVLRPTDAENYPSRVSSSPM
jgi:hypothetical protein